MEVSTGKEGQVSRVTRGLTNLGGCCAANQPPRAGDQAGHQEWQARMGQWNEVKAETTGREAKGSPGERPQGVGRQAGRP